MVLFAAGLILVGLISAFLGLKLFKVLLPLIGFITGLMIGFGGVRDLFGSSVVSYSVAVIAAIFVGALFAILSILFYGVAITVFAMTIGGTAFSYLGVALGLGNLGLIMFLLTVTGVIAGFIVATTTTLPTDIVIALTSLVGVGYVLAGIFLIVGSFSLSELRNDGVITSVGSAVDQSILWLFVWIAGSIIAFTAQSALRNVSVFNNSYELKA